MIRNIIIKVATACVVSSLWHVSGAQTWGEALQMRPVTLNEAVSRALNAYPSMTAARLNEKQAEQMRHTAWDLGDTEISTGGEEIGEGSSGVLTLLRVRQNFDIFSAGRRAKVLAAEWGIARAESKLMERELRREVSVDYACAFIARKRLDVYMQIDSMCADFERVAHLRYTTGETSELEYIAAKNKARQVKLKLSEAADDYRSACLNLSRWLDKDSVYCASQDESSLMFSSAEKADGKGIHPKAELSSMQTEAKFREVSLAKAAALPKFYVEGGWQHIGSSSGYYSVQAGLSIPLFSRAVKARVSAAETAYEAQKAKNETCERQLEAQRRTVRLQKEKWRRALELYRSETLPLADRQQDAAKKYYVSGAAGYVELIDNIESAISVRLRYLDVWNEYLQSEYKLEYLEQ